MEVTLAYTPFSWPAAPPLGISLLKSFIHENVAGCGVVTVDLNVDFLNEPHKYIRGLCGCCDRTPGAGCIPPDTFLAGGNYEKAINGFRSSSEFYDINSHARNYIFFRTFYEHLSDCVKHILRCYIENRSLDEASVEDFLSVHARMLLRRDPDIVGFSAHSDQAAFSLAISKYIKKHNPSIVTVIGGYFPSFSGARDIVDACDFIDYAVEGEGELPLASIIESVRNGRRCDAPAVASKRNGEIIFDPNDRGPEDLDRLPFPDYSGYDLGKYFVPETVLPVLASRGCPWGRCAFCAHRENYCRNYRRRSPENVAAEIERRKKETGARCFLFCDEQVGGRRLEQLSRALGPLGIRFGLAGLKPGVSVTESRIEAAAGAGLAWAYLGVESFSPRILDLMNKGTTIESITDVVRSCARNGVVPFISFMWGFPTHMKDEVVKEKEFIRRNSDVVTLPDDGHYFTLEKNTPIIKSPERFGIEPLNAELLFSINGRRILSGRYSYRTNAGLTPYQAKSIYGPPPDIPYETHSFWEAMVLLAARGKSLVFDRDVFFREIADSPWRALAATLADTPAPDEAEQLKLAFCLYMAGDYGNVARMFANGINESCEFANQKFLLLGKCLRNMEEYSEAIECFNCVIDKCSEAGRICHEARLGRAACQERSGSPGDALVDYETLATEKELHVSRAECHAGAGRCLFRKQEWDKAIEALEGARREDPEGRHELDICFHLSACYEMAGDAEKAAAETKKLFEIKP